MNNVFATNLVAPPSTNLLPCLPWWLPRPPTWCRSCLGGSPVHQLGSVPALVPPPSPPECLNLRHQLGRPPPLRLAPLRLPPHPTPCSAASASQYLLAGTGGPSTHRRPIQNKIQERFSAHVKSSAHMKERFSAHVNRAAVLLAPPAGRVGGDAKLLGGVGVQALHTRFDLKGSTLGRTASANERKKGPRAILKARPDAALPPRLCIRSARACHDRAPCPRRGQGRVPGEAGSRESPRRGGVKGESQERPIYLSRMNGGPPLASKRAR